MNARLTAALVAVAEAMAPARDPWWVIGSAAVALHGAAGVQARDVDVMLSVADAQALAARLRIDFAKREADALFRSGRFLEWHGAAMPVEFMADFAFRSGDGWRPVRFATREAIVMEGAVTAGSGAQVFVPGRAELRALLTAFERDKDLARAALL